MKIYVLESAGWSYLLSDADLAVR